MANRILTTSGFLLPENHLFEVYKERPSAFDSFIGRDNNYQLKTLADYYLSNNISHSPQADLLYDNYRKNKTFENFICMVDFTSDVLSLVDCKSFMDWQAYNRHAPFATMGLCRDLLVGDMSKLHWYDNLMPSSRFIIDQAISKEAGYTRYKNMTKDVSPGQMSWVNVLSPLMSSKNEFSTIFKYFFVNSF